MLVRLLYASRAAAGLDPEQLVAILRKSKANNAREGITGALCHGDGIFLQVLEGGRGAVNRLYQRILADPRHQGVELLAYEEIAERRFAGWAMGLVDTGNLNRALLLKYSERAVLDPFAVPGAATLAMFDELIATASIVGQG